MVSEIKSKYRENKSCTDRVNPTRYCALNLERNRNSTGLQFHKFHDDLHFIVHHHLKYLENPHSAKLKVGCKITKVNCNILTALFVE